jgi:hypothetical protein
LGALRVKSVPFNPHRVNGCIVNGMCRECRQGVRCCVWLLFTLACTVVESPYSDSDKEGVVQRIRSELVSPLSATPLDVRVLKVDHTPRAEIRTVRFSVGANFTAAGVLWVPAQPNGDGVLVGHGHFGQGKSSPEAQEIAHRLAARGYLVLAVDTPGVEEWDVPGRRIHFRAGAHNRAFLAAGGSSALALQMGVMRRGLDVLSAQGADKIVVTGASGGAVQAFFLHMIDERVAGSVLASFPRIPRAARSGGCECDQIPGWIGPDPHLLSAASHPSLWLSDTPQERPSGLPPSIDFVIEAGPHSYTFAMQERAIRWIDELLGRNGGDVVQDVPLMAFSTGKPEPEAARIVDLPMQPKNFWSPEPVAAVPYRLECAGAGPVVVLGGAEPKDVSAVKAGGFKACTVELVTGDPEGWSSLDLEESISRQQPLANRYAGGMARAAAKTGAVAAWGTRAWGLAAAGAGVPFVVRDPIVTLADLRPDIDPPWVHVPGAWWGANTLVFDAALAAGDDPVALVGALAKFVGAPR